MRKLLVLLAAVIAQPALATTYIVNGDFSDASGFSANDPSGAMVLTAGSTAIPGWIVGSGTVLWIGPDGLSASSPLRGLGLFNVILLRSEADSVLQLIDSLPAMAAFEVAGTVQSTDRDRVRDALDVLVSGSQTSVPVRPGSTAPIDWGLSFTSRGDQALIRLSGIDDPSGSYVAVDNIRVAPLGASAVPEPASWAMMIAGFSAVGGAMRCRRRKALATA
jgi:hypothetical protein